MTPVELEAAWLQTSGDGLPALLSSNGGPWNIIQAYRARSPEARKTSIYVLRNALDEERFANQRKRQQHAFRLILTWPIGSSTTAVGLWEAEQEALDNAVDLLLARIRGPIADHSHGGRFLSVAEAPAPGRISVQFVDPAQTGTGSYLGAVVSYAAHSRDLIA